PGTSRPGRSGTLGGGVGSATGPSGGPGRSSPAGGGVARGWAVTVSPASSGAAGGSRPPRVLPAVGCGGALAAVGGADGVNGRVAAARTAAPGEPGRALAPRPLSRLAAARPAIGSSTQPRSTSHSRGGAWGGSSTGSGRSGPS